MTTGNEAEKLDTEEIEDSGVEEEVEASTESTDEAETQDSEVEAWMREEDPDAPDAVGETTVKKLSTKQKLRGKLEEADDENAKLKEEIAALKQGQQPQPIVVPKRPKSADFDTDEEYEDALDSYHNELAQTNYSTFEQKQRQQDAQNRSIQEVNEAVDEHYSRVDTLLEKHAISPEVYKKSDTNIRRAVENVRPKEGEVIVDSLLARLGEGSEKLVMYVGNSKSRLAEFQSLLLEDPTGLTAAIYLGEKKKEVGNTQTQTSRAKKPATTIQGDAQVSGNEGAFKKKYKASNSPQERLDIKSAARLAGFDTKNWIKE